jgi:hypothetical protein
MSYLLTQRAIERERERERCYMVEEEENSRRELDW